MWMYFLAALLLTLTALPAAHAGAPGTWVGNSYFGELSVNVTQIITGCTIAEYEETLEKKAAATLVLQQSIAGTLGLSMTNISSFTVSNGATISSISLFYRLRAMNEIDYNRVAGELQSEVSGGTFDNLLNLFAQANINSPSCLKSAKSGGITLTSLIPTFAPTPMPTFAPTPFTASHLGFLLKEYYVATAIIGSILGIIFLYYGGWGTYYLWQWWEERRIRQERELETEVSLADRKLQQRFVKTDKSTTPHTSKMRENFTKQFGYMPSQDDVNKVKGGASDGTTVPMTNLSSGYVNANPAGGHARTLATRLPGAKASRSSGKNGGYHSPGLEVEDYV